MKITIHSIYQGAEDTYLQAKIGDAAAQNLLGVWCYKKGSEKAVKWWNKAAEKKNADAQRNLGLIHEKGRWVPQDIEKAIDLYRQAAEQDHKSATFHLAKHFVTPGPYQSIEQGFHWCHRGAVLGDRRCIELFHSAFPIVTRELTSSELVSFLPANDKGNSSQTLFEKLHLGVAYFNGIGRPKDYQMAAKLFKETFDAGIILSGYYLSLIHSWGVGGVKQNDELALRLLVKPAKQGIIQAKEQLIRLLLEGRGVNPLHRAVLAFLQDIADQGETEVQYCLGELYRLGKGVPQNSERAFSWIERAAKAGDLNARIRLGKMYRQGDCVAKNLQQARYWLSQGAEQSPNNLTILINLAKISYEEGKGEEALSLMREAANGGSATAQYILGIWYKNGGTISRDMDQAIIWLEEAAKQDYAKACGLLGVLHDQGEGVDQSDAIALKYYMRGATLGDRQAQYNVAIMHLTGQGIPNNATEALKWFIQSAENNYPGAQFQVYQMLIENESDWERARYWLRRAAENDHPLAVQHLAASLWEGRCGEPINQAESIQLLEKGARMNLPECQYALGNFCLKRGDPARAIQLWSKAALQGHPEAQLTIHNLRVRGFIP